MSLIDVIICTHNRAQFLVRAVDSVLCQSLNTNDYRVIIVDNASSDETSEIGRLYADSYANVSFVQERKTGLSYARNAGWREATAPFIAFLDDDAVASHVWLAKLLKVFQNVTPQPGCVGGRVDPLWEVPRPEWLSDRASVGLSLVPWVEPPGELPKHLWLAGANIAFQRSLLEDCGGFPVELGRRGKKLFSMEEIVVINAITEKGYTVYYEPSALVWHHMEKERVNKQKLLQRSFWNGVSCAYVDKVDMTKDAQRAQRKKVCSLSVLRRLPLDVYSLFRYDVDDPQLFEKKWDLAYQTGYTCGFLGLAGSLR